MVKRADDMNIDDAARAADMDANLAGGTTHVDPDEHHESQSDSDRLRADIDRTRAQMDETVDELQHRMSINYLAHSSMEMVRDGAVTGARKLGTLVREHPLPTAVIAGGIVWMILRRSGNRHDHFSHHNGGDELYGEYVSVTGTPATGQLRQRVHDAAETVKHTAQNVGTAVKESVQTAGSRIAHTATDIGHYASQKAAQVGHQLQQGARHSKDMFVHTMDDHPLAVAAALFTIGLAAGLAVPSTRREDKLLGAVRDDLLDRAQTTGADLLHKGEETAKRAVAAASDAIADSDHST